MKSKRRKSTRRALRRAVYGGFSRLRKTIGENDPPPSIKSADPSVNGSVQLPGVLRPKTGSLQLPGALAEAGDAEPDPPHPWLPGPIVIFITAAATLFIIVIAWFVSQMPEK